MSVPPPPPSRREQHKSPPSMRQLLKGSSVVVVGLCALLGFGVITQVRQQPADGIANMRQDDLVRLLDELGRRNEELASEGRVLQQRLDDLNSGVQDQEAAEQAAAELAHARAVLAGTVAVEGPGISLTVTDVSGTITAQMMVSILEELRNAGAEAVEVNQLRLATNSWFQRDGDGALVVDGVTLEQPYTFNAIGDGQKLAAALEIPGGALASLRNAGLKPEITSRDKVVIKSVRSAPVLEYAKPEDNS